MIIHTRLESAHLAGNLLRDPSERDLFVYLPPGYHDWPPLSDGTLTATAPKGW